MESGLGRMLLLQLLVLLALPGARRRSGSADGELRPPKIPASGIRLVPRPFIDGVSCLVNFPAGRVAIVSRAFGVKAPRAAAAAATAVGMRWECTPDDLYDGRSDFLRCFPLSLACGSVTELPSVVRW